MSYFIFIDFSWIRRTILKKCQIYSSPNLDGVSNGRHRCVYALFTRQRHRDLDVGNLCFPSSFRLKDLAMGPWLPFVC